MAAVPLRVQSIKHPPSMSCFFSCPQVLTQYGDHDVPHVLEACERMEANLTAAVVSKDVHFVQHVLANTVNGTTYAGIRARTTGELQRASIECVGHAGGQPH